MGVGGGETPTKATIIIACFTANVNKKTRLKQVCIPSINAWVLDLKEFSIIHNFDFGWSGVCPHKADAVLVIDSDAILSSSISFQSFKAVTRWYPKFTKRINRVKLVQFSASNPP